MTDGSPTRSVDFVTLGVLHPGEHQERLRKYDSAFSREMAQWLDGFAYHMERTRNAKRA